MNSWDKLPEEVDPESLDEPIKRGRGRPAGSTKKVPDSSLTVDKMKRVYDRVKPLLPEADRKYTEEVLRGETNIDAFKELQFLVRQAVVVFSEATEWHLQEGKISRDYAAFFNNLRMAVTDMYAMEQKERERIKEEQKFDDMVRLTEQGAEMDRFDQILRGISNETGEGSSD